MSRYREITPAEMTPAQKEVHDEIVAGRRGRFGGPFQILIRSPEVCRHLSRLGEYLRWGSSLPSALSELAICLTARHLRASYEWHAHAPLAIEAGVPAAAIEAIRTGAAPSFAAKDKVSLSSARSSATTRQLATRSTCSRYRCRRGRRSPSRAEPAPNQWSRRRPRRPPCPQTMRKLPGDSQQMQLIPGLPDLRL
jgi:4-carboxymuconolactone decarboxylase